MDVSRQLHALAALLPGKKQPVPTGYEAGWSPEPAWKLWRREKSLAPVGNRTPTVQLLARRYTKVSH
jgi:hypothetical protein